MYHSITIGNKNTFDDWHLFPSVRPFVAPPLPRTRYVDILGMSGSLDYTEAPNKMTKYADREGSWEFIMLNPGDVPEYSIEDEGSYAYDWAARYSEIMAFLQGKRFDSIVLEDDSGYKYTGRVWVNEYHSDPGWGRIVINYRLNPFKYRISDMTPRVITFSTREAVGLGNNINVTLDLPVGLQPSPLHLLVTTDDQDASHITHGARFGFYNHELGIRKRWTFEKASAGIGSITQYDMDHNIPMTYATFDEEHVYPECACSNINNEDVVLSIGNFTANETAYGPFTVRYWWEEAIL